MKELSNFFIQTYKFIKQGGLKSARKFSTLFLVFTTILWALGVPLSILVPLPASAAVITLSGGGPPDNMENIPPDAMFNVSSNVDLDPSTVSGSTVTLKRCTGSDQTTATAACGSVGAPTVGASSSCDGTGPVTYNVSTKQIECVRNLTQGGLSANAWYEFRVTTGIAPADPVTNQSMASAFVRRFKVGSITYGQNNTPPVVMSSIPTSASINVPANITIVLKFQTNPSPESNLKNNLLDYQLFHLRKIVNGAPDASTEVCTSGTACVVTWDATAREIRLNPATDLVANQDYNLTVQPTVSQSIAIKNQVDVSMAAQYILTFKTASGAADSTGPNLLATNPASGATGVSPYIGDIMTVFNEDMDPSSINLNTIYVYLDANSNSVQDQVETILASNAFSISYNSAMREAHLNLKTALQTSTRYCLAVKGTGITKVTDVVGNDFDGDTVTAGNQNSTNKCFTTGTQTDTAGTTLMFVDADANKLVAHFSELVSTTQAVAPSNYTLQCPYDTAAQTGTSVNLTSKTLTYRPEFKEVEISDLNLPTTLAVGQTCRLTIGIGLTDIAGNAFSTAGSNAYEDFMPLTTAASGGNLGMGGVQTGGGFFGGMSGDTAATFWEKPKRCEPRNRTTTKSTTLECEFPVPQALITGATFTLTFPSGFTLTNAAAIAASSSYMNKDLNGPAPGVTTISGVSADNAAGTVVATIAHSGEAMLAQDMIRFELTGITNPSTPLSDGRISVVIKNNSGVKVGQTIQPAPFDIGEAGQLAISGKVCKGSAAGGTCGGGDTAINNVKVMCSQMGGFLTSSGAAMPTASTFMGHQEATTNASGDWSITGLTAGEYDCNIPPQPSALGSVGGVMSFQKVSLSTANKTGVDFKFQDLTTGGITLNVSISGMNDADADADDADLFCSAGGFDFESSMPVMTAFDWATSGATSVSVVLQPNKKYECGIGPHIAFESFQSGGPPPIPDFDFMPPKPVRVVTNTNSVSTEAGVAITAQAPLTFNIGNANLTILGRVVDGADTPANIANVFVHAFPIGCFDVTTGAEKECMGGFTQSTAATGTSTNFKLKVSPGTYEVGADGPGLPPSSREEITVALDGSLKQNGTTVTSVTLKMVKSNVTISGQILDESGNGIKYAHVSAEKRTLTSGSDACDFSNSTPSGGWADSPTDESGNYTLYASNGTWCVRAFAPAYGDVGTRTIAITGGTSQSGQNIQASNSSYGTISGTVTKASTATGGAFVGCFSTESGASGNGTQSAVDGTWSIKARLSTDHSTNGTVYTCDGFLPGNGPLGQQSVTIAAGATSQTGVTLSMGNPGTVNVYICTPDSATSPTTCTSGSVTDGFVDLRDSTGHGHGMGQNTNGKYTIKIPAGTYTVRGGGPKYGELCSSQSVTVTAGGTHNIICTPPSNLRTVTGTIQSGSTNLAGATVTFTNSAGRNFIENANGVTSGANFSASNIPDGSYNVKVSKKGYEPAITTATVASGSTTLGTVGLTQASGTNGTETTFTVQSSGSNYAGESNVTCSSGNKVVMDDLDSTTGQAAVSLTNGSWSCKAVGDNGKESSASTITVTNGSASGTTTLALTNTISGYTSKNQSETLALSTGGLLKYEDLSVGGVVPEINIPANALSTSDSSTGKVEMKTDPTLKDLDPGADANFVGSHGFDITPKDANGNEVKSLNGTVTITMPYSDSDVSSAGVQESKLQLASFNTASQAWETVPTTVDTTNNILTAQVSHFSPFGILGGVTAAAVGSTSGDMTPPSVPTNISATSDGSKVTLTWTDPPESDLYRVEILRNAGGNTPVSGEVYAYVDKGVGKYVDTAVTAGTIYKYQLRVRDYSLNPKLTPDEYSVTVAAPVVTTPSAGAGATTPTTPSTTTPTTPTVTTPVVTTPAAPATTTPTVTSAPTAAPVAVLIKDPTKIDDILSGLNLVQKPSEEAKYKPLIKSDAIAFKVKLTPEQETAVTNFVSYGISDKTKALGAGERRAVMRDYMEMVNKPEVNWEDVDRISKGEKPMARNLANEQKKVSEVLKMFVKMVGHNPIFSDAKEDLAWNTMMYRIRFTRDLVKEKEGIVEFKAILKRLPKTPLDWSAVRALGYAL